MEGSQLLALFLLIVATDAISFPPSFRVMPRTEVAYVSSEAFKLGCRATGSPTPTYEWYKNDALFDFSANSGRYTKYPGEGTLVFLSPRVDDDGIYQCVAKNEHGKAYSVKTVIRRAILTSFKDSQSKVIPIQRGDYYKMECKVPQSYPRADVRWAFFVDGIQYFIQEDNTKSTDIDGNLYFGRVSLEDSRATYKCTAYNDVIRSMLIGPDRSFRLTNSYEMLFPVRILYRSPRTTVGLRGHTVQFRCIFSGNPPPIIKWYKPDSGKAITEIPNVKVRAMGAILEITNMTHEHVGGYLCTGENSQTVMPKQVSFSLSIEAKPSWVSKPIDVSVAVGSDYTFRCEANGDPKPKIKWYVNGKSADREQIPGKRDIVGNTFVFKKLTLEDTLVVQCNCSNKHGYVFTNAYLNVLQEPPTFTVPRRRI